MARKGTKVRTGKSKGGLAGSAPRRKATKPAAAPSVSANNPAPTAEQIEAAKKKYVRGIISRGEAVPTGKRLPPGVTHEIVGQEADGTPILKRKRFSIR